MLPIIPALVLAFFSFICSAFVILRIVIPILPPHPLSKRVSPAEFGLPTFRSLTPADRSHLWLAVLDIVALALFMWQVVDDATSADPLAGLSLATNPAAAIRLWIIMTIRQTCLLMVAFLALLHVRMAHPVSFGGTQWMLWAPTTLLLLTSTAVAGILSGSGLDTLFYGITVYSFFIAVFTTIALVFLVRTLFSIKKNLTAFNEPTDSWPSVRQIEDKPRPSFATEDIDAIKDGASWITSEPGSRRQSISGWSFSTHHTAATANGRPQTATYPSVPAKSSFWFGSTTPGDIQVPPVPPLPSPYGTGSGALTPEGLPDPDPFRRDVPNPKNQLKGRLGSQSSWLTSSDGSHTTLTAWSFPTASVPNASIADFQSAKDSVRNLQITLHGDSRPVTPALSSAQVLGGYGYAPGNTEAEKGMSSLATVDSTLTELSLRPVFAWSVTIWLPLGLALPYLVIYSQHVLPSTAVQILFTLSVTLSSPLLLFNLLIASPIPIPVGLFENESLQSPSDFPVIGGSFPPTRWSANYKRSTSTTATVVEGRRSGDVWISKGDAVDGKGKFGRAISMLNPAPKLSVLPVEENDDFELPPVPFQNDESHSVHVNGTPHSENSVQFGRCKKESRGSLHSNNAADESLAFGSRIMIAQRHYSALAQTVVVPSGAATANLDVDNRRSAGASTLVGASGLSSKRTSYASHLRSRSSSSANDLRPPTPSDRETCISPPPSIPLPPTPPSVRAARLAMLAHKKSFSSGFSLSQMGDINEIDAMTAGMLPLLVPGLKVGEDMKIKEVDCGTLSKNKGTKVAKKLAEFGEDFSSPEVHSTPAITRQPRKRKGSGHKSHFSLPSLGLGKESLHSITTWSQEIRFAIESKIGQYTSVPSNVDLRRNTVAGVELASNDAVTHLQSVKEEEDRPAANLGRSVSLRSLGLNADVPHDVNSNRSSVNAIISSAPQSDIPPSANSEVTLFEVGLDSGPQAESTPHNTIVSKPASRHPPPPMPLTEKRRSTIRYIKSSNEENEYKYPLESSSSDAKPASHWSTRARSVVPKANRLSRSPPEESLAKDGGLRQLTLLQDRANIVKTTSSSGRNSPTAEIRPLTIGKKQKSRIRPLTLQQHPNPNQDENTTANVGVIPRKRSKNLKELTLVRSETAKARGILRQTEVLPNVVVRPPSNSESNGFAYNFHE